MRNVIKDDKSSLRSFLFDALESCDVIISSGGVSMGRYDYVREVFIDLGVKEHFWKVAQKPGKPFFFGTNNKSLIFGLPGNPVSAYIGFMIWVWPVLKELMGSLKDQSVKGILSEPFPLETLKQRYLFGQSWIENGKLRCKASTKIGSHMLSSALEANCILRASKGEGFLKPGDFIDVIMLPWKTIK